MNLARWKRALDEHEAIISAYLVHARSITPERWHTEMPGRTWSPAVETLHLVKAYELPLGDGRMRMRVQPAYAWVLRNAYLRWLLFRNTFHRGARAPSEVRPAPDEALAMTQDELIDRLELTSKRAIEALRDAGKSRTSFRLQHAYFGKMTPLLAVRMLSAHTRHHQACRTVSDIAASSFTSR